MTSSFLFTVFLEVMMIVGAIAAVTLAIIWWTRDDPDEE